VVGLWMTLFPGLRQLDRLSDLYPEGTSMTNLADAD